MVKNFFFIIVASLMVYNAIFVVYGRSPILSLLALIGCFTTTSVMLLMVGLEFIALLYIAIYIGAITVFFTFVIAMLNIPTVFPKIKKFSMELFAFSILIGGFVFALFGFATLAVPLALPDEANFHLNYLFLNIYDTIKTIALLLYSQYFIIVILLGILLFFGLIGVVLILTETNKNSRWEEHFGLLEKKN
jgi:NADH-quinone oxidoreductase subunit J